MSGCVQARPVGRPIPDLVLYATRHRQVAMGGPDRARCPYSFNHAELHWHRALASSKLATTDEQSASSLRVGDDTGDDVGKRGLCGNR